MAAARRFEDLVAWQKARQLVVAIYSLTNSEKLAKDYALKDQIRRASISVMSNIAEGFERRSRKDFARFLLIAKASCAELQSQLYIVQDLSYGGSEQVDKIFELANETSRVIAGLRNKLIEIKQEQ